MPVVDKQQVDLAVQQAIHKISRDIVERRIKAAVREYEAELRNELNKTLSKIIKKELRGE